MSKMKQFFQKLYFAQTENDVDKIINAHPDVFKQENWHPLGGNENNFGVIENQQSTPIAALIEKITNSIDAVLMKKCLEAGIDPKSNQAPQSMDKARTTFFQITGTGICQVSEISKLRVSKFSPTDRGATPL